MEPSEQNAAVAADAEDHPGVLAPPPLIFLGPLLLGLVLDWALPLPTVHVHVAVRASVGGSLVLLGAAMCDALVRAARARAGRRAVPIPEMPL